MLDVEHGVNVKGGTVLLHNALIGDDARKTDRICWNRSIGVVADMFCRKAIQLICFVGLLVWSDLALAQARGSVSLIRDAEIEATLRQISNPIFNAAGITPDSVKLYIVRDKRLNAFVAGGQNLFLNTGLLQRTEHPGQLAGVIAHEVGHIAGGHLSRVGVAQSRATAEVILATVLGAAAAVAGNPALGTAIITGGQTYAQGEYLSFSRSQEQQADQAAISYLSRLDLSSRGLAEFFYILDEQSLLTTTRDNPYLRSHPLTRDRIRSVEAKVERQRDDLPDFPEAWDQGHQRMVVKLKAFLDDPRRTLNTFQGDALTDRYARAIANYRLPDLETAVVEIDGLIEDYPEDPYFHELKGQMLFEHGRIDDAIEPYREANRLEPGALLRIGLARALIESGDPQAGLEAIDHLEAAVGREPTNAGAWRLLGIAQGRAGEEGEASLSLAEWALLTGKHEDAKLHARRAEGRIGPNDPGWYQLQDILRVIEES
ncbi:MAG: M48 family metalloprotease [Geminicoccaceae bacterium]